MPRRLRGGRGAKARTSRFPYPRYAGFSAPLLFLFSCRRRCVLQAVNRRFHLRGYPLFGVAVILGYVALHLFRKQTLDCVHSFFKRDLLRGCIEFTLRFQTLHIGLINPKSE